MCYKMTETCLNADVKEKLQRGRKCRTDGDNCRVKVSEVAGAMQTQHARGDPFPTAGAGKAGPGRGRVCGPGGGGEEMVVVWNAPV